MPASVDAWFFVTSWIAQSHLRFEGRHADADIMNLLENSVPPADIGKVSLFSQPLARYNKEARLKNTTLADVSSCDIISIYIILYPFDVDHPKKLQLSFGPSGGQEERGSSPAVLLAAKKLTLVPTQEPSRILLMEPVIAHIVDQSISISMFRFSTKAVSPAASHNMAADWAELRTGFEEAQGMVSTIRLVRFQTGPGLPPKHVFGQVNNYKLMKQ